MVCAPQDRGPLRAGPWVVDPERGEVRLGARVERLEPRVMEVLVALARAGERTLRRESLIAEVWGDTIVTDDALQRCISVLRRTLGRGEHGVKIVTVPKVGYRLDTGNASPSSTLGRGVWVAAGAGLGVLVVGLIGAILPGASQPKPPQVRPLTSEPGHEVQPSLAPDGSRVAYIRDGDLHIVTREGTAPVRLTETAAREHQPAFSPDGAWIAFARAGEDGCEVLRVPSTGGAAERLFRCERAQETALAWSPDDRFIAYLDRATDGPLAVRLHSLGGEPTPSVPAPTGGRGDGDLAFSPDGRTLAFSRSPALGVEDVHLFDLRERRLRRLTRAHAKIHGMSYAGPEHLLLSTNLSGNFGLWRQPLSGGVPERLPAVGRHHDAPSAVGDLVVYEAWSARVDLFTATAGADGHWRIDEDASIGSTHFDWAPAVGPDGAVAFLSDRSGAAELWVRDRAGASPRQLTRFGGPYVQAPSWAPDGEALVFAVPVEGNFDVYRVAAAGGPVLRLTAHPGRDRAPSFSADGAAVYFSSDRDGDFALWRMSASGGEPTRVGEGRFAREHEGHLYFTRSRQSGLFRRSLEGGDVETVLADLTPVDERNWVIEGDAVLFVERSVPSEPRLARQPLAGGAREIVAELPRFYHTGGLASGADGRLWLSRVVSSETDLYVIEPEAGGARR